MTIKVHGETYESVDDLNETIDKLSAQLEELPEGAQRLKLAAHIEMLRAAAAEDGTGNDAPSPGAEPVSSPNPPPENDEDNEDVEHTHSIVEAAEYGKELECPLCGQEVPFPEVPPFDPNRERCPDCKGWGKSLTGSRVDGNVWRDCSRCNGDGFVQVGAIVPIQHSVKAAPTPEAPGAVWNPTDENWSPPPGVQPPWSGATWDTFLGKWS